MVLKTHSNEEWSVRVKVFLPDNVSISPSNDLLLGGDGEMSDLCVKTATRPVKLAPL